MSAERVRSVSEARERLRLHMESSRRQTAAVEALFDALPEGLTREEVEWVSQRFARIIAEAGPRRGLCRFERPAVEA